MRTLRYASDNLVELLGPVNAATGLAITSGTCTGRLFYDDRDTTLRTAVASGTSLQVQSTRRWAVGMRAVVWRDTAIWQDLGLVTAVDHELRTLTVTTAVAGACAAGNRVSAALGTGTQHEFAMAFFQGAATPTPGRLDYGFRGTIPDTQVGMFIGAQLRIEVDLDVAAGVRLVEVMRASVSGGA